MNEIQVAEVEQELRGVGAIVGTIELRLPENLEITDWAAVGRRLVRCDQVLKWWLGDWAAFGLRKYGQLKEFAEANGINYGGLRNLAYVSDAIELSRRRDNLDWSKHAEVAPLPPAEQDTWLQKAVDESLTVADLRRQIRLGQGEKSALEPDGPVMRFASKAVDELCAWIRAENPNEWPEERRETWRKRLAPIVEFAREL